MLRKLKFRHGVWNLYFSPWRAVGGDSFGRGGFVQPIRGLVRDDDSAGRDWPGRHRHHRRPLTHRVRELFLFIIVLLLIRLRVKLMVGRGLTRRFPLAPNWCSLAFGNRLHETDRSSNVVDSVKKSGRGFSTINLSCNIFQITRTQFGKIFALSFTNFTIFLLWDRTGRDWEVIVSCEGW